MSLSVLAREDAWSSAQLKKTVLARRGAVRVVRVSKKVFNAGRNPCGARAGLR